MKNVGGILSFEVLTALLLSTVCLNLSKYEEKFEYKYLVQNNIQQLYIEFKYKHKILKTVK